MKMKDYYAPAIGMAAQADLDRQHADDLHVQGRELMAASEPGMPDAICSIRIARPGRPPAAYRAPLFCSEGWTFRRRELGRRHVGGSGGARWFWRRSGSAHPQISSVTNTPNTKEGGVACSRSRTPAAQPRWNAGSHVTCTVASGHHRQRHGVRLAAVKRRNRGGPTWGCSSTPGPCAEIRPCDPTCSTR